MSELGEDEDLEADRGLQFRQVIEALREKLRRYYILLIGLLGIFGILSIVTASVLQPSYTATAIVGPPSSSLSATISGGSAGGLVGLAARFGGGGLLGQQSDPYSTYTALLTSSRLAEVLSKKKGFMETVFAGSYDPEKHEWIAKSGLLRAVIDLVKGAFHYPVKTKPDADDLDNYLSAHLSVDTSLTSAFITVSFSFGDYQQAEALLRTILLTADSIVREDTRANVAARLAYLDRILPNVTQAGQRDTLISLLSTQQQLMMTIAADKLFASSMIDPAHANPKPTFPSVKVFAFFAILLASATWAALVFGLQPDHWLLVMLQRVPRQNETGSGRGGILAWARRKRGAEGF